MNQKRRYSSPIAFKQALEQRLRTEFGTGFGLARRRQLLVFDRYLARVSQQFGGLATLKGGLVLEIRLARARTTKDIDLLLKVAPAQILEKLQRAGAIDLGDFMTFEVAPDTRHPEILGDGMKYDGARFRVECNLGGKIYGQRFGVDVTTFDPMMGEPEVVTTEDFLGFAGVAPTEVRLYPVETHIAEKLHAYTMPRTRPNSRVKDLPDLALLASVGRLDAGRLAGAIKQTFEFRGTHAVVGSLPLPEATWERPYEEMARTDGLPWETLEDLVVAVRGFLDPVLRGDRDAVWEPERWCWASALRNDTLASR